MTDSDQPGAAAPPPLAGDAPKKVRHRGRYARISLKRKQAIKAEAELAKAKRFAEAEAEQARRIDEAKQAIAELIQADAELKRQDAAARRPASVVEYCRLMGWPDDTCYHPRYNVPGIPAHMDEQSLENICFAAGWPSEWGGLGGYGHLRRFIELTWPWVEWNPWLELALRSVADDDYAQQIGETKLKFINWTGPGAAGKTFSAGLFACAWWMADRALGLEPRSSVTLTSTSKGIINQRIWPVIQRCYHEATDIRTGQKMHWGHMVDSQKMVLGLRRDGNKDAKHSICAMAVESGELTKAVDKIKGRHTERMLLIVDEANSTPQAIFECIPNMLTAVKEMVIIVIGNAISRLDPHGLACEPAKGWKSITIEDTLWDTRGVAKWGVGPGVCVHFDGAKSPNVLAGRTEFKHIYSYERWQHVQRLGDEYRNTIQHWSQDRGFWPPDGITSTVFTEAMVISHDGMGKFNWLTSPKPCGSLDPAFGGDNCVLQFGQLGHAVGGRMVLQLEEPRCVPFNPDSPDAVDYQIAQYVIAQCKQRGVEPTLFGLDATGTGRGVAAFIKQLWSPHVLTVEFGGAASDLPASLDDPRASHEIYATRVTELWYAAQGLLCADQLKGLSQQAVREACSRYFDFVSRRYKLKTKEECKKILGYSPDYMDAVAVLVDVARRNGLVAAPQAARSRQSDEAASLAAMNAVYNDDSQATAEFNQYAEVLY